MRFLKALLAAVCLSSTFYTQAALLSVQGPAQVNAGETFSLSIVISDMASADLSAYDLDLNFDSSLFSFNGYTLGSDLTDPLFGLSDLSKGLVSAGKVNLAEVSFLLDFTAQPDRFMLATLNFTANSMGNALFTLAPSSAADGSSTPQALPLTVSNMQMVVNAGALPVPAPASAVLMALGLLALRRNTRS